MESFEERPGEALNENIAQNQEAATRGLAYPFAASPTEVDEFFGESTRPEDLRALAKVAHALWAEPATATRHAVEATGAALVLQAAPGRTLDRAAGALLKQARQQGMAANMEANLKIFEVSLDPFYRLGPEERFLLVALHRARWSYARLARIFDVTTEEIERAAWTARLQLGQISAKVAYPSGASARGTTCPEYFPDRPWTQKFLDDEIGTNRDRLFMQNHLMACEPCRSALERARWAHFAVEALLPKDEAVTDRIFAALERVREQMRALSFPSERTFFQSLRIFCARRDVQFVLAVLGATFIWKMI